MKLSFGRVMSIVALSAAALFIFLVFFLNTQHKKSRPPRPSPAAAATPRDDSYYTIDGVIGAVSLSDAKELVKALGTRDADTLRWAFIRYNGIMVPAGKRAQLLDMSGMSYVQIKVDGLAPIVWTLRPAIEKR